LIHFYKRQDSSIVADIDKENSKIKAMANQSGIVCSGELEQFLIKCRDGRVRMVKISISDNATPELVLDSSKEAENSTWEEDWDSCVPNSMDSDTPCFVLYRLDEKDSGGCHLWVMISWTPESSPTRQKMLYASTKATFKKQFGASQIKDEFFANMREEVTLAGYKKHLSVEAAPGPLTKQEEEAKEIKEQETRVEISVDSKHNNFSQLSFPFNEAAVGALNQYQNLAADYVQLSIDLENESVMLTRSGDLLLEQLPSAVPSEAARYHIFRFKHNHESDYLESNVFIYSMPGYSIPIKERMMYSSCRNAVVDVIERQMNIKIDKKLEVDSGDELTEEFLLSELHPVKSLNRPKFSKPAPPSRGNRRMTKTPA